MTLEDLMRETQRRGASDLHLQAGSPPTYRVDGKLVCAEGAKLSQTEVSEMLASVTTQAERDHFEDGLELDTSHELAGVARFRINACREKGRTRIVLRLIPMEIRTLQDLDLPPVLSEIAKLKDGLVLVTGPTGSGKSTTLAAIINEMNQTRAEHILTIEDPLEYVHEGNMAMITQRELGQDTHSFANALRGAMRQDPDIILIGEMRDAETVHAALQSAETGHLVLSTLHTVDAVETLNRVMDFFSSDQQLQIRKQLASVLRAVISQRILPIKGRAGRCVAAEILLGVRAVRDFIDEGKPFKEIVRLVEQGTNGPQTFDQAIRQLYSAGKIDKDTAIKYATKKKDMENYLGGIR